MKEVYSNYFGYSKDLSSDCESVTDACTKADQTMAGLKSKVSTAPSDFSCRLSPLKRSSIKIKQISKKKP